MAKRGRLRKPRAEAKGVEPLQARNLLLHAQRRTSIRLEPSMWDALEDIARRESASVNELCSQIDSRLQEQSRRKGVSPGESDVTLTSGVRVFISAYFRAACTEAGHGAAGHGMGDPFVGTPFDLPPSDDGGESSADGGGTPSGSAPPFGGDAKASASAPDLSP